MPYCTECGSEVVSSAEYCPECGAPVDQPDRPSDDGLADGESSEWAESGTGDGWGTDEGATTGQETARDRGTAPGRGGWNGEGYPRPPQPEDTDVVGLRVVAQIVDSVVGIVLVFAMFVSVVGFATGPGPRSPGGAELLVILLGIGIWLLYYFLLEGLWDGQTVGKKVVGIKVVTETGGSCTVGASVVRNLLRIVDGFFYYAVGILLIATSDRRQRLGDRAANTVVVTAQP